ncbi:Gfo/Idh/MocA family protein [Pusillimonas noertemannii]|uniref:4,5-dihydroxyphthalate dehydrogenase n=1 Tax=Pusillimonas noertemannii TaxID=305977 RepID=A0A2U1CLK8_9BURK|nr:Gfo/Idh/MocA family oxidoreductase [Pusillimonas noertemannii]NYT69418.1 Gfo/Idh/MocA family oxidoreductase [Pusillimonas noertemannii]PVY61885.1 4,5-dihydroxyphthalate dehydrogenase [Pusillimonas noertemannii]TFL09807.1 Gfo/Idh/MocA family oxidoreductase [Pusillimonas noertemannii]
MSKIPIGIGVVGLGRAFVLMLPTFVKDDRVRLVAAADPRPQARARFTQDFGGASYETIEQLCADPNVELVYIASPHQFHAEHVEIAAAAGKAMLVEKPMAITLDECTRIVDVVRQSKTILVVGHSHSFDGPVQHAARVLEAGSYGQVRMLNALNYTDFMYRPRRPEELDTAQGGGVVFSQAAHQVDVARALLGGMVDSVIARTGRWDESRPTEGAYGAMLNFEGGAFAMLTYSGYAHYDSDELMEGVGEMGFLKERCGHEQARRRLARLDSVDEGHLKQESGYGGEHYRADDRPPAPFHQHFGHAVISTDKADIRLTPSGLMIYSDHERHFEPTPHRPVPRCEVIDEIWNALRHGRAPMHDAQWARATTEVCLAMLESGRSGAAVPMRFQVPALFSAI